MFFTSLVAETSLCSKVSIKLVDNVFFFLDRLISSSRNNSKLPSFSWYYKEWRDGIPELGEVKKPTKSKAGQRCKREVQVCHLKCSDIP